MQPQPRETLHMLFERGRRDALAWARRTGAPAAAAAVAGASCADAGGAQRDLGQLGAAGAPCAAALLATRPEQLPMLVPVPQRLLHWL
jgi:hypothetical protein